MTVHIVEDDEGTSDILVGMMENLGRSAVAHYDAESLLASAIPAEDDTVIVDLGLPGISGVQLIRWLTHLREPPKVVAISGQSRALIEAATRSLPLAGIVSKPLRSDELARLI